MFRKLGIDIYFRYKEKVLFNTDLKHENKSSTSIKSK